jgi:thymidylate kinase
MKISNQAASLRNLSERETKGTVGLEIVNQLIRKLHEEKVVYCHWKSNEHLREGMLGTTDLDILVERNTCLRLSRILGETGFKRFAARPWRTYPAIEDYLAVDPKTGKLVHLHLHYQLTLGEKHLKGYRLPWEDLILSTRQFSQKENIYVADPNIEMILLLVRAALKLRTRDRIFSWLRRPYFGDAMLKEFRWLKERTQMESVVETAEGLLGKKAAGLVMRMMNGQPSLRQLRVLRKSTDGTLRLYRTYGKAEGVLRRWLRELYWLLGAVNKRYLHTPVPFARTAINGGLLVALLGPDGSGKSALAKEITPWLSWKVDVLTIYFGSGEGASSLVRWPLLQVFNILKRKGLLRSTSNGGGDKEREPDYRQRECCVERLKASAKVPWALVLAYEKRRKLLRAWRARNLGMVVICDRYPQCQVMGFNDGPLLSHWLDHPSGFLRAVAQWEFTSYRWSETYPPDLVIKLDVSPEIAVRRKPDDSSIEKIRLRMEAIKGLRYPPATGVVTIDADDLMDEVLLKAKQVIWERI